jgi:Flp pilus assembly protein TadD
MSATRIAATVSLAALALTGCIAAPPPNPQELALIETATSPILPATKAERDLAEKQDLLTQAKFWGEEYEKNPNEYEASLKYARVLRAIGSSARATEITSQAMTLKPGDVELTMIFAQANLDQGKAEDAAMALARAEPGGQSDWRFLSIIGVTMDSLDQHAGAQDYYRKALALSPENPKILANLGLSYALEGKPGLAEQTLRQAMALPGADSRVTQNLIVVLGVQGKFEEAEKIAGGEMPKALIESNREYFRAMLNPSRSWETLRGTQN